MVIRSKNIRSRNIWRNYFPSILILYLHIIFIQFFICFALIFILLFFVWTSFFSFLISFIHFFVFIPIIIWIFLFLFIIIIIYFVLMRIYFHQILCSFLYNTSLFRFFLLLLGMDTLFWTVSFFRGPLRKFNIIFIMI